MDKLVQQAIRILITPLFEPHFSISSHGFRQNRSCHSALKQLYLKCKRPTWFIEADIEKCFDRINHPVLLGIIGERLDDPKTILIIKHLLRCGYIHFGNLADSELENHVGTPQGSILSPLLCNIFLDRLDQFMEHLAKEFNTGPQSRARSSEYLKMAK